MDDASVTGQARWFDRREDGKVVCSLCPHRCVIAEGSHGTCRVRQNSGGSLTLPFYGRVAALAVDPIEKKPLYHFFPGSRILSVGFVGCSLRCKFCQNWHISQSTEVETWPMSPADLVRKAREAGSFGIAYTYSEPLIHTEYLIAAASAARKAGLKNVLVSNGYLNAEPAEEVLGLMDAANIDLKAFDNDFYRSETGGNLDEVKRFLGQAAKRVHLEVTTLVIPTKNDDPAKMEETARFVASLGATTPFHLSCYYPQYKYTLPPTPPAVVKKLREVARRHLPYVYVGNVGDEESNTTCPSCGALLVRRLGYSIKVERLADGACRKCGARVPIVM
ncbi:MAG TPA: AmmeMemoRadiSam system radical SAM enzyme [Spirochaetia bacterium]|nr:AmmeMemoRadiSam system radical SAM enzyme [Spirochaetia bacterium]